MRTSSIGYLLKEGFRNIYANRLMSIASIGVLMACLLLIGSSLLLTMNINSMVGYMESQNEVMIFMVDNLDEDFRRNFEQQLDAIGNMTDVQYVSKEDGLSDWVQSLGVEDGLFDILISDNVLPDSYRITIVNLALIEETVSQIENLNGVDSTSAPYEVANAVVLIKQAVTVASFAIVLVLVVVAMVIIANTIRITVFNRRREIGIMKFVGATDTFIRLPFIVEGFLLGLISAILAFVLLLAGYSALGNYFMQDPTGWFKIIIDNMIAFKDVALQLFLSFAAGGIAVGTFGSALFVRKYLKV